MDLELKGRRVLVAGGTGGIGRAILSTFANEGAKVAFFARTAGSVERTDAELRKGGATTLGRAVDFTDATATAAFLAELVQAWGGLDVLVIAASSMALQGTDEAWQAAFQTDVLATVKLIRACTPILEKSGTGSIVVIGSSASTESAPLFVPIFGSEQPYGAVKAALANHVKLMSIGLAAKNIRINMVSPGNVYIPGGPWDQLKSAMPQLYEAMLKENPTGRMATTQEVADCVTFLASPRASFVLGQNLLVDGGLTRSVRV